MTYFAITNVILAVSLFVAVTAKVVKFNPFYPYDYFSPQNYQPENNENPQKQNAPIYKDIVFGEDVEGAYEFRNFENTSKYGEKRSEITSDYSYEPESEYISMKITKIVVQIAETGEEILPVVILKDGGVGEEKVSLEILAQNTNGLHYRVRIFGIEANKCKIS